MSDMKTMIYNPLKKLPAKLLYLFFFALAVFVIQSCNDNDDDPTSPAEETLVEVAQSDSNFTTLVSALEDAGLVATLEGDGPFTVFAPTNDAFENLPDSLLDTLSNNQLTSILTYHVISEDIASGDLEAEQSVATVLGDELYITANGSININDSTAVVDADIEASNGRIHSIDRILLPNSFGNIFDIIVKRYFLSTLEDAVRDADLVSTLQEDTEDGYTVFAPDNEAFDSLPEDTLDSFSQPELQDLLTYHVLSNEVLSSQLSDSQRVETVSGDSLLIEVANGTVTLTDNEGNSYEVTTADLEGTNGVVHIINGVLFPGEE